MLTDKDVKHIANLARIKLSKGEEKKFSKELASIFNFIDQLSAVDTSKIEPAYQIPGLVNSFRTDEYRKNFEMNETLNEKLIGQAPHQENRFVKVKSILSRNQ